MKRIISILILFIGILQAGVGAQNIRVESRIDSSMILMGNQAHITLEVTQRPGQVVLFPVFTDSIPGGLDVVEPLRLDTTAIDGGNILVKGHYVVTGFQDSLLYIPPMSFVAGKDTLYTKSLSLKVVQPFKVDLKKGVFDIKNVMFGPFDFLGTLMLFLMIVLIHGLIVAGIFIYRKYFRKYPVLDDKSKELLLPPHVVALSYLEKIKQEKPWQQGRSKEYHTQLTDVMRSYIERMFSINCMEMTSEEILEQFRLMRLEEKSVFISLKQILSLADLVKFAKYEPAPDEHELSLMNAYLFINQTKVEEAPSLDTLKADESNQ